jgi:hypothetical protein
VKRLYAELPGDPGAVARPVLDVVVEGMTEAPVRCLVDSGAVHTLLPRWVAHETGVDLDPDQERALLVGGGAITACFTSVGLAVGDHGWDAPVGFCDPWPYGWGLLGQLSFFRYFVVTFRAADWELEIEPLPS